MSITKFLGIQNLPDSGQSLFRKYAFISIFGAFFGNLSSTFFILFAIDEIGYVQASYTISFMLLTQLIFDYPSGSLGDWIGQKWVLTISMLSNAVFFYLLTQASTFNVFLILAFFGGFANAQASGTLETWLDNNYKKVINTFDLDRKVYGFGMSRINSLNRIIMAFSFILGGYMATNFSRRFVFIVQASFSLLLIIIILLLVNDVASDQTETNKHSTTEYFHFFIGGLKFLFTNRTAFFFLIGTSLIFGSFTVWGNLLLLPIYFGYSGSDDLASIFRTIMFLIGIPIGVYMARISQKFQSERVSFFYLIGTLFYYLPFIFLLTIIPPTNSLNLTGLVISALILTFTNNFLLDVGETLRLRTMIDLIPSENRNAVYSLIPSLVSIISIPLLPITGELIARFEINIGVIIPLVISFIGSIFMIISLKIGKKSENN